ncbi:MAG: diaminobutyrate acetyltransferase [Chloroflexota bacterium]|nr:diaminobutyrate acetyltransferase [Chloroflexota bacterium]
MNKADIDAINIRNPNVNDGARIWNLVHDSKPLDLNSPYLYLLLCQHYYETCLVAEKDAELLGFVAAYIPPKSPDVLFVWQVAVHSCARQQGLAKALLHTLIRQDRCQNIKYIEVTIAPSNQASKNLFLSFARELNVDCKQTAFFMKEFFPEGQKHEEEILFQIGPWIDQPRNCQFAK